MRGMPEGWDITVLDQIVDLTVCIALCQINDLTGSLAGFPAPALSKRRLARYMVPKAWRRVSSPPPWVPTAHDPHGGHSHMREVREEMLLDALITRKTVTVGEKLILPYRLPEAVTVRDSLAKSLYSALFDWIVFRINHALLNINSKAIDEGSQTLSIGVLDIFGFEDYGSNSFEQFCINFANERLQHYFNQHLFQLEQEQYRLEGISWSNINYTDNERCINLISKRPTGLIQLLDEESNFPQATHQTLLEKFKRHHESNPYIEFPAVMEPAFIIQHYAGKVKYGVKDFREKNTDHMRPDIVALLRSSRNAFIRGMIAISPVGAFRWALLRAFFRALWAFRQSGKNSMGKKTDIPRPTPRTPLSDLQGVNTIQERTPR
ncbi:unnamed protein product [Ranitomeya imitator]|uniref:Myosin motor domain-containing protein n=1 Tax=Ranitomeya imitator TaxID=111125 RepID=A0ABN9L1M3_9NEOB|nr:unnamed protein product [Ranitomeya imitator]